MEETHGPEGKFDHKLMEQRHVKYRPTQRFADIFSAGHSAQIAEGPKGIRGQQICIAVGDHVRDHAGDDARDHVGDHA